MQEISTPCIGLCEIDKAAGLCRGCWRTLKEIGQWRRMSEDERLELMAILPERSEKDERNPP
jgi:uncharacterized protein